MRPIFLGLFFLFIFVIMKACTIVLECQRPFDYVSVIDNKGRIQYFRSLSSPVNRWSFNLPFLHGAKNIAIMVERNGLPVNPTIKTKRLRKLSSAFISLPLVNWRKPHKKISFDPNTDQLAYNHVGKSIHLGPKFFQLPYFLQKFVLLHEIGHNYYYSEENADLFAAKRYIQLGGNYSDILYALDEGLTQSNLKDQRIKSLHLKLINHA